MDIFNELNTLDALKEAKATLFKQKVMELNTQLKATNDLQTKQSLKDAFNEWKATIDAAYENRLIALNLKTHEVTINLELLTKITGYKVEELLPILCKMYQTKNYEKNEILTTHLEIVEITSFNKLINTDHLSQVTLNNEQSLVCGASNLKVGQKTLLAKSGAILNEITIQPKIIQGVESNGMLVGIKELLPKHIAKNLDLPFFNGIIDFNKYGISTLDNLAFNFSNLILILPINQTMQDVLQTLGIKNQLVCNYYESCLYLAKMGYEISKITNPETFLLELCGQK